MTDLERVFSPVRELAHHTAMQIHNSNMSRAAQIASVTAILEGTMAAAVQVLGAEDAFNIIQPLVDRILNSAFAANHWEILRSPEDE